MYIKITFLGKDVIQTNTSKFDERLFSDIYLCRLRLKQGRERQDFMFRGREFQRDAPAKDKLVLNKSSLGLGTKRDRQTDRQTERCIILVVSSPTTTTTTTDTVTTSVHVSSGRSSTKTKKTYACIEVHSVTRHNY